MLRIILSIGLYISTTTLFAQIPKSLILNDTSVKFLWRQKIYDTKGNTNSDSMVINNDYCKIIPNAVKAAVGYEATFIGNDCDWDGKYKEDRSNLKCKILTALNLGYQGSEQHVGFLRHWFRNDSSALFELKSVPTIPFTSTIQNTFDSIEITVKHDTIKVWYRGSGINVREDNEWTWTDEDEFKFDKDNLRILNIYHKKINSIKDTIAGIDDDSSYTTKTLDNMQFLDQMTDGGGQLTGYYKNGQLIKITEWIGLSGCVNIYNYYLLGNLLIYVEGQGKNFKYIDSNATFDYDSLSLAMDFRYYYDNNKLISFYVNGTTHCAPQPNEADAIDCISRFKRYVVLLRTTR